MSHYASPFATVDLANDAPTFRFTEKTMTTEAAKLLRRIASGDSPHTDEPGLEELVREKFVREHPGIKGYVALTAAGSKAVWPWP